MTSRDDALTGAVSEPRLSSIRDGRGRHRGAPGADGPAPHGFGIAGGEEHAPS